MPGPSRSSSGFAFAFTTVALTFAAGCSLEPAPSGGGPALETSVASAVRVASVAAGRGECTPGQVQTDICFRCGTRTRTCYPDGSLGDWSRCQNPGVCDLGESTPHTCSDGTVTERRCTSACTWGEPEATCDIETADAGATPATSAAFSKQRWNALFVLP